jgi:CDP-glucose 4,6-dehydratase
MVRDYIYVRDAVRAYLLLAEKMDDPALHGHAFNFSAEQPLSVLQLLEHILRLAGRPDLEPKILGEATSEIPEQYLSARKAREMLDWAPGWSLEDALKETIAWYKSWLALRDAV